MPFLYPSIQKILQEQRGIVCIIGDTFTGKTFAAQKAIQHFRLSVLPIDYENPTLPKSSNQVESLFASRTLKHSQSPILFCDALDSYPNHKVILTFLRNAPYPSIVTTTSDVVIPKADEIHRIWWNEPKHIPPTWKGDTAPSTPKDMFQSLTSRKVSHTKAYTLFESEPFLLTQYYHEEYPNYKQATMKTIVTGAELLSDMDVFRLHDWMGNGLGSVSSMANMYFVRKIRRIHRNPALVPKKWFPSTLSKQSTITNHTQELGILLRPVHSYQDAISIFAFKIGKSYAYKHKDILRQLLGRITPEQYSRILELMGHTPLTKTEMKRLN